jgi:hypothetical protein
MGASRHGSRLPSSPDSRTVPAVDRITVALVAKAASDLQNVHERTRLSKTDIVNRAISLYEFVDEELSAGAELVVRRDGQEHLIKLL